MEDEEKKIRYEKIVDRLRTIYDEIEILESHLDNLRTLNENTLNVNGLGVGASKIDDAERYLESASNVINNTIIPRLDEKINSQKNITFDNYIKEVINNGQ